MEVRTKAGPIKIPGRVTATDHISENIVPAKLIQLTIFVMLEIER